MRAKFRNNLKLKKKNVIKENSSLVCVTYAFTVDRQSSFESAPGLCVLGRQVRQQGGKVESTHSHRGRQGHGWSQQLLHKTGVYQ